MHSSAIECACDERCTVCALTISPMTHVHVLYAIEYNVMYRNMISMILLRIKPICSSTLIPVNSHWLIIKFARVMMRDAPYLSVGHIYNRE